ncbi:unnamed protein product [Hapterophycus canaliculatus]
MSDAAMKVDPEYYNKRLLETNSQRGAAAAGRFPAAAPPSATPSWGGGGGGASAGGGASTGGINGGNGGGGRPDLPDYLVRQHSLLGLCLSLNPGDEADAERQWGFPQHQRAAIVAATVMVSLLMALFLSGSWLWKASVIAVVAVFVRLALSFTLATFPDVEVSVQGYNLAVWPHFTLGGLALIAMVWFVTAAASGTGWSTMWLAFTSLLLLAFAEGALRGGMWHYRWWVPAERFSFLKPWGDSYSSVASGYGRGGAPGAGPQHTSYAPPRPTAAAAVAPAAPRPAQQYGGSIGEGGRAVGVGVGVGDGVIGVGGGGGGGMNGSGATPAASKSENTKLLEENGKGIESLEDIFSEPV